jgi:AcrR family transcriptional regulator
VAGNTAQGRTGRRPGPTQTRGEILDAARAAFAGRGYDGVSVRAVARAAGVDPALVHRFHGSKEELFVAAMALPVSPSQIV